MQRALIAFTLAGLLIIAGCGGGSSVADPDVGGNLLDIIGSDGSLTGFGGGLPIKQALLALERGENPHFPEQLSLL